MHELTGKPQGSIMMLSARSACPVGRCCRIEANTPTRISVTGSQRSPYKHRRLTCRATFMEGYVRCFPISLKSAPGLHAKAELEVFRD
jgi:hypothetical protein